MGAKRPPNLAENKWNNYLLNQGLELLHTGKVRDTYRIDRYELLQLVTDNISIFNFVLNAQIPGKGECLVALTHFWLTTILKDYYNHLIQDKKSPLLNKARFYKKHSLLDLPLERCLAVQDLTGELFPFEFIYRHHIGGSIYEDYLENGGKFDIYDLPPNLPKWSKLAEPIFTPTDKSENDERVSVAEFTQKASFSGTLTANMLAKAYCLAYEYAQKRGIRILDTKFEAANMTIADEILTPDSSRFADEEDWKKSLAEGREPNFFDKQIVREWGKKVETPFGVIGLHKLKGSNPEHVAFAHSLTVPKDIIETTAERYQAIVSRITGLSLKRYQKDAMGITA